jgi:hypothetical protein
LLKELVGGVIGNLGFYIKSVSRRGHRGTWVPYKKYKNLVKERKI